MSTQTKRKTRKRNRMEYSSDECDTPLSKKRKIIKDKKDTISITDANRIKQMLKESSVLLQNTRTNKFIEVGICYDGKAYSMIKGDVGTNGQKQTRNFNSEKKAFNSAL
eukprot:411496_1